MAFEDRELYIQTGYGTEGFLTDAMAKRIIDQVITPAFRSANYYQGLDEGSDIIMQLGTGEFENTGLERKSSKGAGKEALFILFGIILIIVVLANIFGNGDDWDDDSGYGGGGRYDDYGRRHRRRGRGGWIYIPGGGGGWNNGGGGGFGGGGFGGFGGGGFGGGGAGGSW